MTDTTRPVWRPSGHEHHRAADLVNRSSSSAGAISQAFDHDDRLCWVSPTAVASPTCANPPTGAASLTYNTRGDRTATTLPTGDSFSYAYDEANQLISYTNPAEDTTTYSYDGDGLRATVTTSAGTGYDTWNRTGDLPLLLADGTDYFLYGPGGTPIEQIGSDGTVTYLHTDRTGSVRLLTDATGTVVGSYSYDPWGRQTSHTGTTTPLGYDGQYTEPDGLIYLRHRYYDPSTAQFLTQDPALDLTGQPYEYADDDPINNSDPLGLWCISGFGWACHAANWTYHHAGDVATVAAVGGCLAASAAAAESTAPICLGLGAAAFAGRTTQRIANSGLKKSIAPTLTDAMITGATLGLGSAVDSSLESLFGPEGTSPWSESANNAVKLFVGSFYMFPELFGQGLEDIGEEEVRCGQP